MNEEEAFLRAICENPDDDTPRLVFADWLTEQGGPVNTAWANAIRAQIWLACGATDSATAQRSRLFETSYGQSKMHERLAVPHWLVGQWERGFPTSAAGNFRELRDAWPRLAFRLPIRKLNVYEVNTAHATEFVTWPALSVLHELELCGVWETRSDPNVVPVLAGCGQLQSLRVLKLHTVELNDAVVTTLLNSPYLANVNALRLDLGQFDPIVSRAVKARLLARFGSDVFDGIPF